MDNVELINLTNMSTNASLDLLKDAIHPGTYRRGNDIEKFIIKCTKYFDISGIKIGLRSVLVVAFVDKELREIYENEDDKLEFEERIRKAFYRPTSMLKDMEDALNYRRSGDHINMYKKKIEEMVDKLMSHKWNKEELTKELIMNSCEDKKIKLKIKSKKIDKIEEIFQTIKDWEDIKEEVKIEDVNVVRSYRDAVRRIPEQRRVNNYYRERTDQTRSNERREITCWTCNKIGHISRNCQAQRKKCYACGSEQHLRRDCDKVSCSRCNRKGHQTEDCYTNLNKQRSYQNSRGYVKKEIGNGRQ